LVVADPPNGRSAGGKARSRAGLQAVPVAEFVEKKKDFSTIKGRSVRVGDVKTFENFIVAMPKSLDASRYNTAVVWCETFSMFITAAKYR
jgi:hypothetical protein